MDGAGRVDVLVWWEPGTERGGDVEGFTSPRQAGTGGSWLAAWQPDMAGSGSGPCAWACVVSRAMEIIRPCRGEKTCTDRWDGRQSNSSNSSNPVELAIAVASPRDTNQSSTQITQCRRDEGHSCDIVVCASHAQWYHGTQGTGCYEVMYSESRTRAGSASSLQISVLSLPGFSIFNGWMRRPAAATSPQKPDQAHTTWRLRVRFPTQL